MGTWLLLWKNFSVGASREAPWYFTYCTVCPQRNNVQVKIYTVVFGIGSRAPRETPLQFSRQKYPKRSGRTKIIITICPQRNNVQVKIYTVVFGIGSRAPRETPLQFSRQKYPKRSGRTKIIITICLQRNNIKAKFVGASLEAPWYFTYCTVCPQRNSIKVKNYTVTPVRFYFVPLTETHILPSCQINQTAKRIFVI